MGKRLIGSVGLAPGSDSGFDLDTKGQVHGYSSTQYALDVGTANQGLLVDSSATAGIKWGASATSTLTTTGDLLVASGANTLSRIAGGTSGDVLTAGGAGVVPTYQTPSGGGAWEKVGSDIGDQAALSVSGITGSADIFHIFYNFEPSTISTSEYPRLRVNGVSLGNYDQANQQTSVSSGSITTEYNQTATGFFLGHEDGHTSEYQYFGDIYLQKIPSSVTPASDGMFMTLRGGAYRNDSGKLSYIITGAGYQPDTNDITDVSFTMTSGNISGSIQVNSLTYG